MRNWIQGKRSVLGLAAACLLGTGLWAQAADAPKEEWEVHDAKRPAPAVITPGTFSTQEQTGKAPSDAIVLFDGKDLSAWVSDKGETPKWKVENGYMEVVAKAGGIRTKEQFGDCQLHVEWAAPSVVKGDSQGRGNSGVFIMGLYEFQVLDTFNNKTYADGGAGSIYGQYPPLVNATLPPGQWQVYDIVFRRPHYQDGKVVQPARATVFLNGVLVQDNMELIGPTSHKALAKYPTRHPEKGPIALQDHGNPVRFRNIWIRPLPDQKPVAPVKPNSDH